MKLRGRRLLFAAAALVVAFVFATAAVLAVDVYLHGRYERSAGFNSWGYRGRSVGSKQRGEFRVAVLGGSTAYGYGVLADDAMPAGLERLLRARSTSPVYTVANLAYNNEGAYSFTPTLEDYRWLNYDLAVLYTGYNDLSLPSNRQVFRRDSPVFRLTGYLPIFPMIFKEKAAAMLHGGDPGALYDHDNKTVFHPSLATRAGAGVLDATAEVARSLGAQLGRVSREPDHHVDDQGTLECVERWRAYCESIALAVEYVRGAGAQVLVAAEPALTLSPPVHANHVAQQTELRRMMTRRFGADPSVRYMDLTDRVDLSDPRISFDRMHLTEAGNRAIAAALEEPVLAMAARRQGQAR